MADYTSTVGLELVFAPGTTLTVVQIGITNDSLLEGDEDFEVRISTSQERVRIERDTAVVTITDDDSKLHSRRPTGSLRDVTYHGVVLHTAVSLVPGFPAFRRSIRLLKKTGKPGNEATLRLICVFGHQKQLAIKMIIESTSQVWQIIHCF